MSASVHRCLPLLALLVALPVSSARADDAPMVSSADVRVAEGDSSTTPARFVVTLSAAAAQDVTLRAHTEDASARAGEDYLAVDTAVTIPAGQTSATVDVPVVGDTAPEPDKSLTFVLTDLSGATFEGDRSAYSATILDDDAPPPPPPPAPPPLTVSAGDVLVTEGDAGMAAATFTVSLNRASDSPVSVRFVTLDNTAVAPRDYLASAGLLPFAPGETSKAVTVQVVGDRETEPTEYFGLMLKAPSGVAIDKAIGVGVIADDDPPQPQPATPPSLTLSSSPLRDRHAPFTFAARGHLVRPLGRPGVRCRGRVELRLLRGTRSVGAKVVALRADCSYRGAVRAPAKRPGRLTLAAHFAGTDDLLPADRRMSVRAG